MQNHGAVLCQIYRLPCLSLCVAWVTPYQSFLEGWPRNLEKKIRVFSVQCSLGAPSISES